MKNVDPLQNPSQLVNTKIAGLCERLKLRAFRNDDVAAHITKHPSLIYQTEIIGTLPEDIKKQINYNTQKVFSFPGSISCSVNMGDHFICIYDRLTSFLTQSWTVSVHQFHFKSQSCGRRPSQQSIGISYTASSLETSKLYINMHQCVVTRMARCST